MIIGERIKAYREANHITQQELADKIGATRQAVSAWEQNRALPRIGAIDKMSQVFKISRNDLIGKDFFESTQALNDKEILLLQSFREVDKDTQEMVLRLLHIAKMGTHT